MEPHLFLTILLFLVPQLGVAHSLYLSMQGKCLACHTNPMGGEILNDRGRRLNATYLASRAVYADDIPNKTIEKHSGFWFTNAFIPGIRPDLTTQISHRQSAMGESRNKTQTEIDYTKASLTLLPNLDETLVLSATLQYIPDPSMTQRSYQSTYNNWDLPQHYLLWKINEVSRILFGMSDKFMGAQQSDLKSFTRLLNQNQENDQVHQLSYFFENDLTSVSLQLHAGDLYQQSIYREAGAVGRWERRFSNRLLLGLSGSYSQSQARKKINAGPHMRFGGEDRALIMESYLSLNLPESTRPDELSFVGSSVGQIRLAQGLHSLMQFEFMRDGLWSNSQEKWRMGPGIWYAPIHRLKFESYLQAGRSLTKNRGREEDLSLWLQLKAFI